jgi:hypothetical protein
LVAGLAGVPEVTHAMAQLRGRLPRFGARG